MTSDWFPFYITRTPVIAKIARPLLQSTLAQGHSKSLVIIPYATFHIYNGGRSDRQNRRNCYINITHAFIKTQTPLHGFVVDLLWICCTTNPQQPASCTTCCTTCCGFVVDLLRICCRLVVDLLYNSQQLACGLVKFL